MEKKPASKGIGGWLGRQLAHVIKAVKTPVEAKKIYRQEHVEEAPHPTNPNVTLRRTVKDELIVKEERTE